MQPVKLRPVHTLRLIAVAAAWALAGCSDDPAPAQAQSTLPAPPPRGGGGAGGGLGSTGNDTPVGAKGSPHNCFVMAKQAQENCLRSSAGEQACNEYYKALYQRCAYGR